MRSSDERRYSLLFFLSGATGLAYELLWVRMLYQGFGSTIQSVTAVVAAYMGGLGLGAWMLGRRGDRNTRPAVLYGALEIGIGTFGIVSPFVLAGARAAYLSLARATAVAGAASVALRFGLAGAALLIPTTLMGGTLPVLTRAFAGGDRARLGGALGRLYALNTLGAVCGAAITGFFLIEHAGIHASLAGTGAVSMMLGGAALRLARPVAPEPEPPAAAPRRLGLVVWVALVLLGVTAFGSLLDEIAWTRVLVMIVGGSTYAFTLVLLAFLAGIGLGSWIAGRRAATRPATPLAAALAQGITGAGAALLLVFFAVLPRYVVAVLAHAGWGAGARLAMLGLAVGAVVTLPAVGMGLSFPLLAELTARRDAARGGDVGVAYALNTAGAIAGAVLTGFVLVATLGTEVTLRIGLVINAAAALALVACPPRDRDVRVLGVAALAAVTLAAAVAAPSWSTRLIDVGPTIYGRNLADRTARDAFLLHRGARQLAFREGRNATVSVWESVAGRTLKVNGKVDASDRGDMDTEIMLGLAPAAARPDAASALVIGFGSGVTTRVLADVPTMRRVRVVEIEPAVLAMAPYFAAVNGSVLERPGVSAVADDARSALQLSGDRYDVIVSEPSNPWVAGVATLYTPEFFRIVRSRLAPGGVFCQWIQTYQLPLAVVAAIVRNLRQVFPHVEVWFANAVDIMVLASDQPLRYDRAWLDRLLAPAAPVGALAREWMGIDSTGDYFGRYLLGEQGSAALASRGDIVNGDDRPQLEFVAARRFLDPDWDRHVLDSLAVIGVQSGESLGVSPELRARAVAPPAGHADTASVQAGLARAAADAQRWPDVARDARIALALGRGTTRHPFPAADLQAALEGLALRGPPRLADSVLVVAAAAMPGWDVVYKLRTVNALRGGACHVAAQQLDTLSQFGIEQPNAPALLASCRAGFRR